jgi:actin-like ATPase involved in cell morphogenesis
VEPWVLSIDFGTTNTAAAVAPAAAPDRAREVKLASASTEMPSCVLSEDGELLAGEVARNLAPARAADAFEPTPKRRLGEPDIVLARRIVDPVDLVAAVLGEAARRASRQFDGSTPSAVRLTHPARWASWRRDLLVDAAGRCGVSTEPELVAEPVAAAACYAARHGEADQPLAVYDLGGGTFDIAVLRPTGDGAYELLATEMVDPLGGELFDLRLLRLVEEALAEQGHEQLAERISDPSGLTWRRTLLDEVRRAKHVLSERASASVVVRADDVASVVTITRSQFEDAIRPELMASIDATRRALDTARVGADELGRLCCTGGSSFVPLVHQLLEAELGLTPATFDDPKTITAIGAFRAVTRSVTAGRGGVTTRPPSPSDDMTEDPTAVEEGSARTEELVPADVPRRDGPASGDRPRTTPGRGAPTGGLRPWEVPLRGAPGAQDPPVRVPQSDEGGERVTAGSGSSGRGTAWRWAVGAGVAVLVGVGVLVPQLLDRSGSTTFLESVFVGADLTDAACRDADSGELGAAVRGITCDRDDHAVTYLEFEDPTGLDDHVAELEASGDAEVVRATMWGLGDDEELGRLRLLRGPDDGQHWTAWTIDELSVAGVQRPADGEAWDADTAVARWREEVVGFDAGRLS